MHMASESGALASLHLDNKSKCSSSKKKVLPWRQKICGLMAAGISILAQGISLLIVVAVAEIQETTGWDHPWPVRCDNHIKAYQRW